MINHIASIREKLLGALTLEEHFIMVNLKIDLLNLKEHFDEIERIALKECKIYTRLPSRLNDAIEQFKEWN